MKTPRLETKRMVQVLHKCETDANGEKDKASLAVGKTFQFSSGDAYTVQDNGSVVNANPKRYTSKADKKAMKRASRQQRESEVAK
jgi:hypothetical protein